MADRRLLPWLALALAVACAEDELDGSLAKGECSPSGKCAVGYECDDARQCVPIADGAAGQDSGPPDVESDAPCAKCPAGSLCCNDACVDKEKDPTHCGSCTTVCPGTLCQAGSCTNECQPGLANCNKNALDGCEAPASSCPPDASTD